MAKTILVLNGPNLELPGKRESEMRDQGTLADIEELCRQTAGRYNLTADCRQSDREDELIDFIHEARANEVAGIVVNAGGRADTSTPLRDALTAVGIPTVEVHVTNGHARESFRHHSFAASAAIARLCGFGIEGYRLAISGLAARIGGEALA